MKYRVLGRTQVPVSVIGVGAWQFGGEWGHDYTEAEVAEILDTAKACGINLIDTAECYGDHLSERLIGAYLKTQRREDWVVATKFGHKFLGLIEREDDFTAAGARRQLEDSLRALGTDYVDLLQFHSGPDEAFFNDELWTTLDNAKREGKVRHLGLSINGGNPPSQAQAAGKYGIEAMQVKYNRLERVPEEAVLPACIEQNLGVLIRVPLASGYLTGKYKPGVTFADNDFRSKQDREHIDKMLREAEAVRDEVPEGVPMAQWALGWCLLHDAVSCVIPGMKNPDQVRANAAAGDLAMVDDNHRLARG